jgi:hypothetical protein
MKWMVQFQENKTFCESNEAASGVSSLRFASCASSERSEGSLSGERSFATLRMTKRDALFFRNVLIPSELLRAINLSAFALDLCGFGVYTSSHGAAGAMSFHDPLEGTEISFYYTG